MAAPRVLCRQSQGAGWDAAVKWWVQLVTRFATRAASFACACVDVSCSNWARRVRRQAAKSRQGVGKQNDEDTLVRSVNMLASISARPFAGAALRVKAPKRVSVRRHARV